MSTAAARHSISTFFRRVMDQRLGEVDCFRGVERRMGLAKLGSVSKPERELTVSAEGFCPGARCFSPGGSFGEVADPGGSVAVIRGTSGAPPDGS